MEIAAITTGLGALKHATDIARLIKDSSSSLEQSETKLRFAELIDSLAEAKLSMAALKEVVDEKQGDVDRLEKAISLLDELTFDGQFYAKEGDSVPFCPRCFEVARIAVHLTKVASNGKWVNVRNCPECKTEYHISNITQVM